MKPLFPFSHFHSGSSLAFHDSQYNKLVMLYIYTWLHERRLFHTETWKSENVIRTKKSRRMKLCLQVNPHFPCTFMNHLNQRGLDHKGGRTLVLSHLQIWLGSNSRVWMFGPNQVCPSVDTSGCRVLVDVGGNVPPPRRLALVCHSSTCFHSHLFSCSHHVPHDHTLPPNFICFRAANR